MSSGDADDELARTATAHDSSPDPASPSELGTQPETIGRYKLERTLGVGGMGVVHVAFDPDLERRVALKVLRAATGDEAAKRLQREARAMARLNHPNVVTVHEVGSVGGRDYVAMELVDGESLAEWLRAERRDPREIVEAFIAAGRGLAAAHAAGIIHRDFKPHNVLRSRTGEIAVTDFGLAREANDPLAVTLTAASTSNTPTSLSGLTVSGSVLGTPAYMAPEQWLGADVTPATDQFGFCVALWEALSGERPYRGPTVEDLRAQVAAGPKALDASRIPRRLRPVLRRGLDPDPAKRWKSMDALLAALARAQRRPWLAVGVTAAVALAGGVLLLVLRGGSAGPACPDPALDPSEVWNDGVRAAMERAGQGPSVDLFASDHRRWREIRTTACSFEPGRRAVALACLDGVAARFDAVARAAVQPGQPVLDTGSMLIDPSVCGVASIPRLVGTATPQLHEVIAARLREMATSGPSDEPKFTALAERAAADPCAEALAQSFLSLIARSGPARDRAGDLSEQAADRCGDDRIRAEVSLATVSRSLQSDFMGTSYANKLARAEAAVQRVPQADLNAWLAQARMLTESRNDHIDKALEEGQAAIAGFAARGRVEAEIRSGIRALQIRQTRASPEDLTVIASSIASWRQLGVAKLGPSAPIVRLLDTIDAGWQWTNGDVAGAHARLDSLRKPEPNPDGRELRGIVTDASGAPVAGATVAAGKGFKGDSISILLAFVENSGSLRTTVTNPDGTFVIPDAVPEGMAVAQLGELRSDPVALGAPVKLVLEPTARITGTVDLRGTPPTKVVVAASRNQLAPGLDYAVAAPVSRDGSFTLAGVPRGDLDITVVISAIAGQNMAVKRLTVTGPALDGVALAVPATQRLVQVIVRSTVGMAPGNAQVMVMPGKHPEKMMLKQLEDQFGDLGALNAKLARPVDRTLIDRGDAQPGDLAVTMAVPDGPAAACGLGLPADVIDPSVQKAVEQQQHRIEIRCVAIPVDATSVLVRVPPWPRFD